jgi:hypothetical protein
MDPGTIAVYAVAVLMNLYCFANLGNVTRGMDIDPNPRFD